MKNPNTLLAAALAAVLIAGGSIAGGAIWSEATQTSIKVCVNKTTKVIRYKNICNSNERSLRLSMKGEAGKSAYQIWLDQGYRGTERDFLNFLRGANGASPTDFARNCYQQLKKAESQGVLWTNLSDRRNFERTTGCVVREIDLNPNSHAPGAENLFPRILRSELIGFGGGASSDHEGGLYSTGREVFYQLETNLPQEYVFCSKAEQGAARAFYADNGKLYAKGSSSDSFSYFLSELNMGYGSPISEITGGAQLRDIFAGDFIIEVLIPTAIPLGETATGYITDIRWGYPENGEVDIGEFNFNVSIRDGEELVEINEADAGLHSYAFEITANNFEYGSVLLDISGFGPELGLVSEGQVGVGIGVSFCETGSQSGGIGSPLSWSYQIHEDKSLLDRIAFNKLEEIGWDYYGWFTEPSEE